MRDDLVIWDCDGTLIDSEAIAGAVCAAALCSIGHPMTAAQFNARFTGIPAHETWEMLRREIAVPLPDGFNAAIDAEIHRRFDEDLVAVEGAREAVLAVPGARCVASSTRLPRLEINLRHVGLAELFAPHIYSVSHVSRGKPEPDLFLFAAGAMRARPETTVVIEDSVAGVTAGVRAGMRVIGFTGAGNGVPGLDERLLRAGASRVVAHMRELPGAVEAVRGA